MARRKINYEDILHELMKRGEIPLAELIKRYNINPQYARYTVTFRLRAMSAGCAVFDPVRKVIMWICRGEEK